MIFLNREIPIERLRGRTREVWMPSYPLGKCKILGYSKDSIRMEVLESARKNNINKIFFISKRSFFMSLSEEQIDNYELPLPLVNLPINATLYEKK